MSERKPILKIEMTVKGHTTNELSDKEDSFAVQLKNNSYLMVGLKEAKAKVSIKALDSILHYNFPIDGEYILEIYPKTRSTPTVEAPTQQTPLDNHDEAFASVPSETEEEAEES